MGQSRPLFGLIHCSAFYNVDYHKRLIMGHFRIKLTGYVFGSGINSATGGSTSFPDNCYKHIILRKHIGHYVTGSSK